MSAVIGIAAPPGGGKSSLARSLASRLGPQAVVLDFDHYQSFTNLSIDEISQWLSTNGNVNYFEVPLLVEHLKALKNGEQVVNPVSGAVLAPKPFILLETHFGRAHHETGKYIDYLFWVETPLDVALARNVQAFCQAYFRDRASESSVQSIQWLAGYVDNYLQTIRETLLLQKDKVGAFADFHLNGELDRASITRQALEVMSARYQFVSE